MISVQPDRAIKDPEWALEHLLDEDLPHHSLEKSWAGIPFLLDAAEVRIELAAVPGRRRR